MKAIDRLKEALAEAVDEYVDDVDDQIQDGIDFEIDHLEEENEMLKRAYDEWRRLFADIFNVPICLIEDVEDARRWARKG